MTDAPRIAYRVAEVAAACGVSKQTVHNWIRSGVLPTVDIGRKPGQAVLIPATAVEALVPVEVVRPAKRSAS